MAEIRKKLSVQIYDRHGQLICFLSFPHRTVEEDEKTEETVLKAWTEVIAEAGGVTKGIYSKSVVISTYE